LLDSVYWRAWFTALARPEPMATWSEAFSSQPGLAKRHNTLGFLQAIHLNASLAANEQGEELDQWVMSALQVVLN